MDSYEETLDDLRRWLDENVVGVMPLGPYQIMSLRQQMVRRIAKRYDVPDDWVAITELRLEDQRTRLICSGFKINLLGGLDSSG